MKNIKIIIYLCLLFLISCKKQDIKECSYLNNSLASKTDFYCGTVVDLSQLTENQNYSEILNSQFNSITAENIMKPDYLHPTENTFNWAAADDLADYCTANGKRLHGHTLIWHQQLPNWILNYQGSRDDWERLFKNHITTIVDHFKGKITSWDVVNEAFNDDGTLRNSIWKQKLGSSYIEKAFRYAHEADPNSKLFYNDYSIALKPIKRAAIINYMNQLKAKGTPIDGIGLQMHIFNGFPENSEISSAVNDIWMNDYLVHISELDISINPLSQEMTYAENDELVRQAEKYLYIFKAYDQIPDKYKFGITIWGIGDSDSWIRYYYDRDDYPLLFDDNYEPKPAYCKLISNL